MTNGLVQLKRIEKSTRQIRVKQFFIRVCLCAGHLAVVDTYDGHTVSLERQTSECLIEHDQSTPLLQEQPDEDDTLLNIQPTVSYTDSHSLIQNYISGGGGWGADNH